MLIPCKRIPTLLYRMRGQHNGQAVAAFVPSEYYEGPVGIPAWLEHDLIITKKNPLKGYINEIDGRRAIMNPAIVIIQGNHSLPHSFAVLKRTGGKPTAVYTMMGITAFMQMFEPIDGTESLRIKDSPKPASHDSEDDVLMRAKNKLITMGYHIFTESQYKKALENARVDIEHGTIKLSQRAYMLIQEQQFEAGMAVGIMRGIENEKNRVRRERESHDHHGNAYPVNAGTTGKDEVDGDSKKWVEPCNGEVGRDWSESTRFSRPESTVGKEKVQQYRDHLVTEIYESDDSNHAALRQRVGAEKEVGEWYARFHQSSGATHASYENEKTNARPEFESSPPTLREMLRKVARAFGAS